MVALVLEDVVRVEVLRVVDGQYVGVDQNVHLVFKDDWLEVTHLNPGALKAAQVMYDEVVLPELKFRVKIIAVLVLDHQVALRVFPD